MYDALLNCSEACNEPMSPVDIRRNVSFFVIIVIIIIAKQDKTLQ